jgi:hypothetical protein
MTVYYRPIITLVLPYKILDDLNSINESINQQLKAEIRHWNMVLPHWITNLYVNYKDDIVIDIDSDDFTRVLFVTISMVLKSRDEAEIE